MLADNREQ